MIIESKQAIHYIHYLFFCYYVHIQLLIDKKLKFCYFIVLILLNEKIFGYSQISVPKIGMLISKTASVNPQQDILWNHDQCNCPCFAIKALVSVSICNKTSIPASD